MKLKHHIIPKHSGGTNDKDNIIIISPKMHIALHKDRWKVLGEMGDYIAWKMMMGGIVYEEARREAARARMLRDNPAKRPEVRKKLSENNSQRRKEVRLKNSLAKKKLRADPSSTYNTEEYRKKRSEISKGKNNPMYGKAVPKKICEFCKKEIDIRNYSRWHGEKCKKITKYMVILIAYL